MDFLVVIAEFKNMLKVRGYAGATVDCYSQYLGHFLNYLRERDITDLKKVTGLYLVERLDLDGVCMDVASAGETKQARETARSPPCLAL